ncbi:DUF4397 domain-containing protein [Pedobacter insulae]|uniref:DUF4397 domain-containing protein n=1 Tax=Pedobacter insulae TaxID=414048 RepID=A0A1I2X9S6_9SPHI|nr:DUF4397 domain-containing protein [Pedobacter insulae]SFH10255.1 protein of unknown function [Pedobacter insulae]
MNPSINYKNIIAAFIVSILLTSCKKNEGPKFIDVSGLSIVNASPSTEKLDVYVDNTKVTNAATDFVFGGKIDYLSAYSGSRKMTITRKDSPIPLKSELFVLEPQYGYTLFILDRFADIKFMMLSDNLTKPPKGKASIRFANLSPDTDPLTLAVAGSNYLITNVAFKNYSIPIFIDAGDKVNFEVREHSTGSLIATLPNVKIEEEKIYTIYVKGLKASTDEMKLGVAIYTHK